MDVQRSLFDETEPEPTDAMPGSWEKLQVLIERAANGQELWHPDDRLIYDETDPD